MTSPRSSPEIIPTVIGRQSLKERRSVERIVSQRLDSSGDRVGVPASLGGPSSSSQGFASSVQTSCFSGSLPGFGSGDLYLDFERSNRRDFVAATVPRILWPPVLCSEGVGGVPPSFGSFPPECLPEKDSFPYGNRFFDQSSHPPRRLGDVDRSEGRIFSCVNPSSFPEMAQVHLEEQDLPVQGPPVRIESGPMGVYPYYTGDMHSSSFTEHPVVCVPGRLADFGGQSNQQLQPFRGGGESVAEARFHSQRREVRSHPVADVLLPGHEVQYSDYASSSFSRKDRTFHVAQRSSSLGSPGLSAVSGIPSGPDGISCTTGPSGSCTQERTTAPVPKQVAPVKAVVGHHHPSRPLVSGGRSAVDAEYLASAGSSHLSSRRSSRAVHRCVDAGLGCSRRRSHSLGSVVPGVAGPSHQLPRDVGSFSGCPGFSVVPEGQGGVTMYRQHHSFMLCEQGGGIALGNTVSRGGVPPSPVSEREHHSQGKTHPRCCECSSRLSESSRHGPPDRMDSRAFGVTTCVESVAQAHAGLVRNQIQQETANLCLPRARSRGPGDGCVGHGLDRSVSVRFSSSASVEQSYQEGQERRATADPDSAHVAGSAVVSGAVGASVSTSTQTKRGGERLGTAKVRHPTSKPRQASASRLANVRQRMRTLGASRQLCDLVSKSHRSGTNAVYSCHWKRWVSYCAKNNISPSSPSEVELGNFLAYLSHDCKLSVSSVRVYRAAICTTLRQLGSKYFPESSLLRDLIRGASIKEARAPRRLPAWDLFLILASLREAPYEPLFKADLKSLTFKTVFLLALASGRRASEVCNLSGLSKDIATHRDGTILLKFLPEFLAKNQNPLDPSPSILIKPLTDFLCPDDPDLKLCPVRSLRRYLKFTRTLRVKQRKLFISFNPYHTNDISKASVSRWLRLVIKSAYATSSAELSSVRAHEVRAWAASTAFAHSWSLKDVLNAAYWRSETSFINYYLRDVSLTKDDGTHGIASFVAAQQVISSRRL